jgi:O-antigen/teichoic acid export membrane protein
LSPGRRDLVYQLTASGAQQISLLVTGVLLARLLGPVDRGLFALFTNVASTAAQLAGFGVASALTFAAARLLVNRGNSHLIVRLGLRRVGIACCLSSGVALLYGARSISLIAIVGFAAGVALAYQWGLGIVQGASPQLLHASLRALQVAGFACVLATAAFVFHSEPITLNVVLAVWLTSVGAVGCLTVWRAVRALPESVGSADAQEPVTTTVTRFAKRGFIAQISPVETFRVDTYIAAAVLAPRELGLYAAALGFVNIPRFLADAISAYVFPRQASGQLDTRTMRRLLLLFATCGLLAAGVLSVLGPWLVALLLGPSFAGSAKLILPLSLVAVSLGGKRLLLDVVRGAGQPGHATKLEVIGWPMLLLVIAWAVWRADASSLAWAMAAWALLTTGVVGWRVGLRSPSTASGE